uniref:Uncharacterized protein n=1 Tax=Zonotrichia albicollis TaxID=44394 RepID=A0A8D2M3P0_ZONAL
MKLPLLALFALVSVAHCEDGARLLASKSLLNRYAVEGKDLTLQYNIYNVVLYTSPVHLGRLLAWPELPVVLTHTCCSSPEPSHESPAQHGAMS